MMKVKIIRSDVSRMENGFRLGKGDICEITKEEYKANMSAYAPIRVNVRLKKKKVKNEPIDKKDVQQTGDIKD